MPPPWSSYSNLARGRLRLLAIGAGLSAVLAVPAYTSSIANSNTVRGDVARQVASEVDASPTTPASTLAPTSAAPPTTPAPTLAPTTLAPTTVAPTTVAPTTVAPTTTVPSPAIVWVGGPGQGFAAVGGSGGSDTARIQQRLIDLGFWVSAVDGQYGLTTSQAVMAFQKYVGLEATGRVNQATADALTSANWRAHGLADAGTLVEVDKTRQLIFIVQNGRTVWVLNTSTGDGEPYVWEDEVAPGEMREIDDVAITRNGLHAMYRQRTEGWWDGDLGKIYRPKYFSGGQAVHGSNSIPNYPASKGCVRVSVPAMDYIWDNDLMPIDIPVWVHGPD